MVDKKNRTDISVLSGGTGDSVKSLKRIPGKKNNIKSLAMSPQIKDMVTNNDTNILGTKKDQSLPQQLAKYFPGYKSLINETENGRNDYTDTSHTDK